ncbi:MAG: hypothetical protein JNN04_04000 [Cyclobacteriaceae bacterium]|nr:hypothetical protein [Cyclobacteriaceae bacterium]
MKDRTFFRTLMIAAGILAAVAIVVSPTFRQETERVVTELKADRGQAEEGNSISPVSADAVTSPQAVEVESANPFIIQEIILKGERPSRLPVPDISLPASALTTLLRSVISPQAP